MQKISVFLLLILLGGMVHDVQHRLADYDPHHVDLQADHEDCILAAQTLDLAMAPSLPTPTFTFAKSRPPYTARLTGSLSWSHYQTRAPPILS
ncbi:MAG: hypothetical protein ACON4W_06440 [Parvibaculales bacterium]